MTNKEATMDLRSDADLQAIQTSVAFKNISDAVEQYRRQFGLAFLALITFSAIHVGLVVIANLYTMQTRVSRGVLTDAADSTVPVATGASTHTYDLSYIMTNLNDEAQLRALNNFKSASFVDRDNTYRQYTVTGYQLGGYKRSELKLYTSVGHILEYVRGKGIRVFSESGSTARNCTTEGRRKLLQGIGGVVDANFGSGISGNSDEWKDNFIKDNLPKLKTVVANTLNDAMAEVDSMSKSGWSTDSDTWGDIIFGNIAKTFDKGLADQYAGAYASDMATAAANVAQAEQMMVTFEVSEEDMQAAVDAYSELYTMGQNSLPLEFTGVGMYAKAMATAKGNYDQMIVNEVSDVLATIYYTTAEAVDSWATFEESGYIGKVFTGAFGALGEYGCSKDSLSQISGKATDGGEMAYMVCEYEGGALNLMGGFFFSEILGSFEAFVMHLPPGYCSHFGALSHTGKEITFDKVLGEYMLYLMHGWGESGIVLVEAADTITGMSLEGWSIPFLTICPEDAGTPYGSKTWYVNTVFTGYHQDMIVFELPSYISAHMGMKDTGKGIFGFSMGAAGSLTIGFTYATKYSAIAAFNGPVDADECFFRGYCHVHCGVDAMKCEIMWSSSQAAYNPYVVVHVGGILESQGYYDPVNYGSAAKAGMLGYAGCQDVQVSSGKVGSAVWVPFIFSTETGRFKDGYHEQDAEAGMEGHVMGAYMVVDESGMMGESMESSFMYLPLTIAPISWATGYFYLNAVLFTRSSSGYNPSHNPMTGKPNKAAWYNMLYQFPLYRVEYSEDMFNYGVTFFLVACDFNDQYGLYDMSANLASYYTGVDSTIASGFQLEPAFGSLKSGYHMKAGSGVIHDGHAGCGHCMDLRDFRLAYQFMSDVFGTVFGGDPEAAMYSEILFAGCCEYMSVLVLNPQSYIGPLSVSKACINNIDAVKNGGWKAGNYMDDWGMEFDESGDVQDVMADADYLSALAADVAEVAAEKAQYASYELFGEGGSSGNWEVYI
jgi:hypothetical protein